MSEIVILPVARLEQRYLDDNILAWQGKKAAIEHTLFPLITRETKFEFRNYSPHATLTSKKKIKIQVILTMGHHL